jgi:phosphoribosylformylglycinamidine cyclo-ligase
MADGLSYRDAGVDLEVAERAKEGLKALVASTRDENTLSELGAFGGLYAVPAGLSSPVLVSSADGVGTKLKVAFAAGRHDTVGHCLVNHCVNDILVQGARPLFFLDYLATGDMDEHVVHEIVRGVANGCRENGCALLGGETAEMPGFYADGEYDLTGFIVGAVEADRMVDGRRAVAGDCLVGLPSSGLHTNGYSLARRILFDQLGLGPDLYVAEVGRFLGEELLQPHRSYLSLIRPLLDAGMLKAMAHITGGGITDNLPRALPDGLAARVDRSTWKPLPIFEYLQNHGEVPPEEMFRTFNMGIGMILVVARDDTDRVLASLTEAGERGATVIGEVAAGTPGVVYVS